MTNLAASSQTQLRYIPETVEGVTPTTGNGVNLRMTGETLDFNLTKDSSKEINASRQIRGLAVTNAQAQGAFNFEMVYKEYEAFFASLLMGVWSYYGTAGSSTAPISATFAPANAGHDTITASVATAGNDAWTKLKKGDYVRLDAASGSLNAGNQGFFQLDADGTTTVLSFALGSGIVAQAGANLKVSSAKLQIGTTPQSFTLEKEFSDVNQYFSYNGMRVSKMDLSLSTGNFITGSFDFLGRKGARAQATILPGTPVVSQPYRSMSAVTGVPDVRIDGVPIQTAYAGTFVKEITVSFDNQLEGLQALGTLGNVAVMPKTINLTGGLSMYLDDSAALPYDDFIADITHNFSFIVKDPDGNGYAFVFDQIDYSSMPVQGTADGQAVMMDGKWTGIMGATSGNSMTIYRL